MNLIEPMLTDDDVEGYLDNPESWRYRALLMDDPSLGGLLDHPERTDSHLSDEE